MRTKALLLAAAVMAVGASTLTAQVYSANAVGYVNLSLPTGFSIIANPLDNTNNELNTLLAGAPVGTRVYRFDAPTQNYISSSKIPPGWAPNLTFDPGEGFFIDVAAPLNVTFVGEVPQGNLNNPLTGGNAFQIKSSQVPQALPLGRPSAVNPTLEFPAAAGDRVYTFDNLTGYTSYTYNANPILGWLGPNNNGGDGPTIPVASGFFLQRAGTTDWARTFSVN
jgi:hypothetical protein